MTDELIHIDYQRTPEDMARLCSKLYFKRTGVGRRFTRSAISNIRGMFLGVVIVYSVTFFMNVLWNGRSLSESLIFSGIFFWNSYLLIFFAICFLVCVLPSVFRCESCVYRRCKKSFSKDYDPHKPSVFYCPKTLKISSECVSEESKFGRSELFWSAISSVEIIDDFLCLFIGEGSGYIIPERYFNSPDEKQHIYEQCVKWWEATQEKSATQEAAV